MISTSQREHLKYTAIGQWLILGVLGVVTWNYILPGMSDVDTRVAAANTAILEYKDTIENGVNMQNLGVILSSQGDKAELIKVIQTAPKETEWAIKKVGAGDYLPWLKDTISNKTSKEEKEALIQVKKKLNSILPTMSPISANIDEENVTLREYIKFIEENILKKFDIDSNISLGMQGLTYGGPNSAQPKNVGMFDLRLDFKASNKNIAALIDYVNQAGNPSSLTQTGVLDKDKVPTLMSNPLLTIESFSLQDSLDLNSPEKQNNGRASIRFYIRGSSMDDITFLRNNLKTRKEEFGKWIDKATLECKNSGVCAKLKLLEAFAKKYREFTRSIDETKFAVGGTDEIYALSQQVNSLRLFQDEFEKLVPPTPVKK
jgi:hypothetical protein